ncbi:MAG TPA: ATP-grasp domain-containing protein [Gaiellaceae bacterium]|nr:ATP-grasp domain-containing protein [Gaiellaceae bacterium]
MGGATVVVVSAGYPGKRRAYVRLAELGARLVIVDEPGHWSESLVTDGLATRWLTAPVDGDPDRDAEAVLATLAQAGVRPDGVLTFWEDSISAAARVAVALGLPGNPPDAVDAARSKVRTRELATRLGLPTPRAKRVQSLDELFAAAGEVGFPAVVKPEFGAGAAGCVRVDDVESLPGIYSVVRRIVDPEQDVIFRAGNDLLLEEYLDGVEFDVDLVMEDGKCLFSSVSQNWPTAEPSFQETGLHCPPDHDRKEVRRLVRHVVETVCAFGLGQGVLHVEGKCTSRGPRIVEVNARMGGGRVHEFVEAIWGVDLIEAQLRSCLGLPQALHPSRKPQAAVVDALVYAPATGRLEALPLARPEGCLALEFDVEVPLGAEVRGPDALFATTLAEVTLTAKNLRTARALMAEVLVEPPQVA